MSTLTQSESVSPETYLEEKKYSWVSRSLFLNLSPIYALSNRTTFEQHMHIPLSKENRSQVTYNHLNSHWRSLQSSSSSRSKPTDPNIFLKTILSANKGSLLICFFTGVFLSMCEFGRTAVMYYSLKNFKHPGDNTAKDEFYNNLWVLLAGLAFSQLFYSIIYCYLNYYIEVLAQRFTSSIRCLVFDKILKMSFERENVLSLGEIMNIVNSDISNLEEISNLVWDLFAIPIDLSVGVAGLYYIVGYALFPALGVLATVMLVNYFFSKLYADIKKGYNEKKDIRTNTIVELFENIRLVKLNGLETIFVKKIIDEKEEEIFYIRRLIMRFIFSAVLNEAGSALFLLSLNAFCLWMTGSLSLEKAFTSVLILNIFKKKFKDLPDNLSYLVDVWVSCQRITFLLFREDVHPQHDKNSSFPHSYNSETVSRDTSVTVTVKDGEFHWVDEEKLKQAEKEKKVFKKSKKNGDKDKGKDKTNKQKKGETNVKGKKLEGEDTLLNASLLDENVQPQPAKAESKVILRNLNFTLRRGTCTAVIGSVGSGKSSLLSAIMGEMHRSSGTSLFVSGKIAYTSQTPWLLSASIKDNIELGRDIPRETLQHILSCVCLDEDLTAYNRGIETQIGAKGVGLSGGQKARVCLARAMCSLETELFLLDDPISALDVKVGRRVMENCVLGYLKGKTVVIATHAVDFLPYFDQIIVMDQGEIKLQGTYNELWEDEGFQRAYEAIISKKSDDPTEKPAVESETQSTPKEDPPVEPDSPTKPPPTETEQKVEPVLVLTDLDRKVETAIEIEDKARGSVGSDLVWKYCLMLGKGKLLMIVCLLGVWSLMHYLSTWFLQFWIKEYDDKSDVRLFVGFSLFLLCTTYLTITARALLLMMGCNQASRIVNSEMAFSLGHASICKFFDRVPIGRVLNRFSKDTQEVDQKLFINIDKLMTMGSGLLLDLFVSVIVAGPLMIPLILLFLWVGLRLRNYNMNLMRECTRLQGITSSPISHIFTEAVSGTKTIRAYGCEEFMIKEYQMRIDENLKNLLLLTAAKQWFAQRIQMMAFFIIVPAILLSLFAVQVEPGYFAILLVYMLSLGDNVKKLLSNVTKTENRLVSFERCQFFMNIPPEEGYSSIKKLRKHVASEGFELREAESEKALVEGRKNNWPQSGKLEFRDVSIRYRAGLPYVLQNVSFSLPTGTRLGILGRTGAGKTSLMSAIYSYFAEYEGDILYDGTPIRSVDLQKLRSSITIIPQEPVLFNGTLRKNIDPFSRFTNAQIESAMQEVTLSSKFAEQGLDFLVESGGANISQGEKQLICFSRALLTQTPLVLMDEATASIDPQTENTISRLLEERFKNRTILMIAHKLQTVLSCDR